MSATSIDGVENDRAGAWFQRQAPAVLLDIQRQPGANTIETWSTHQGAAAEAASFAAAARQGRGRHRPHQTIRASVADVQFTLVLTVGLVVMVIFVFLRNFWATVIPSVAVPLSLVGTFGVMYAAAASASTICR